MYGHLLMPEAYVLESSGWVAGMVFLAQSDTSVQSKFAMLDLTRDPPGFPNDELFSVPTSDLL